MSFINKLKAALGMHEESSSAASAKERLMVTVSHQRRHRHSPDYLPLLEKDIIAVIAKYVEIEEDKVGIRFDRGDNLSTLEVNVELPSGAAMKARVRKLADTSDDLILSSKYSEGSKKKDKESLF